MSESFNQELLMVYRRLQFVGYYCSWKEAELFFGPIMLSFPLGFEKAYEQ